MEFINLLIKGDNVKKRYILLTMLLCTFLVRTGEEGIEAVEVTRSGSLIAPALYYPITPTRLDHGLTITKPGAYVLGSPVTVSAQSAQESGTIAGAAVTNAVIRVSVSDVNINLNGYHLRTDKDALVAIIVDDGLTGVTIENGSISSGAAQEWQSGIVVGHECSNIIIRDINVIGCDGATFASVEIKGDSGTDTVNNVLLDNVTVLSSTATAGVGGIKAEFVDGLTLRNIRANNGSPADSYTGIWCKDCNNVNCENIEANNNINSAGLCQGMHFLTCKNVSLNGATANSNAPTGGATFDGIFLEDCLNVTGSNININNNAAGAAIIGIKVDDNAATSRSVKLDGVTCSNNATTAGAFHAVSVTSTNNVSLSNCDLSNNSSADATATGMLFATCNDVTVNNVLASGLAAGAVTTGVGVSLNACTNFDGRNLDINNMTTNAKAGLDFVTGASSNVSFENVSITNCASSAAGFIGVNGGVQVTGLRLANSTIANCTGTTTFTGVLVGTAGSTHVVCDGVDIISNTGTGTGVVAGQTGLLGFSLANINDATVNNCRVEHNTCAQGDTDDLSLFGLQAASSVTNLSIANSSFSHNIATYVEDTQGGGDGAIIAGVHVTGSATSGLSMNNCEASNNDGPSQAFGFWMSSVDNAVVSNCVANGNKADTFGGGNVATRGCDSLPSAGFFVSACDFCSFDSCTANNNRAGDFNDGLTEDNINLSTACAGFGFLNLGTNNTTFSIGNTYTNCVANGNNTQLSATAADVTAIDDGGGNTGVTTNVTLDAAGNPLNDYDKRYNLGNSVCGGFGIQWSRAVSCVGCTANNNGSDNDFVIAYGFLVVNEGQLSEKININKCSASNNQYFGFVDSGVQTDTTQLNAETTFTQNYSCMNGAHNDMFANVEFTPPGDQNSNGDLNGDNRNYWMHFTDPGQVTPIISLSYGGQTASQGIGNEFFNISMTYQA